MILVFIVLINFKLKGRECENLVKIFIEGFFIFMYSVSILWLLTILILITVAKRKQKVSIKSPTGLNRPLSLLTLKKSANQHLTPKSVY